MATPEISDAHPKRWRMVSKFLASKTSRHRLRKGVKSMKSNQQTFFAVLVQVYKVM